MFHGSQQKVHYWTAHLWQWHFNATMVNTLQKYAKRWICLSDFSQSNVLHAWWSWLCVYVCVWFMYSLISLSRQLILLLFFTGKIGFLHFYILMRSGSGIIDPWSLALAKETVFRWQNALVVFLLVQPFICWLPAPESLPQPEVYLRMLHIKKHIIYITYTSPLSTLLPVLPLL